MGQECHRMRGVAVGFFEQLTERIPKAVPVGHHHRCPSLPLPATELREQVQRELPGLAGAATLQGTQIDGPASDAGLTHSQVEGEFFEEPLRLAPPRNREQDWLHAPQRRTNPTAHPTPQGGFQAMLIRIEADISTVDLSVHHSLYARHANWLLWSRQW